MKWSIYIIFIIFFSCEKPTKQENAQTPIVQKDTLKQALENTELLSGKQLLDSLLKKAKYRDLKKIEIPEKFALGYWHTKSPEEGMLSPLEYKSLALENPQFGQDFRRIYIYTYLGKSFDKHLFLILRLAEGAASASDLWMVDSLGKIVDIQEYVAYSFGDAGFVGKNYTHKINDSTFITNKRFGDILGNVFILTNTHFIIRKDSFFVKKTDTLLYQKPKIPR